MVKKKNSKKSSKMQLRDEVGDDDSYPITVPDNTVDDYPPPDLEETRMRLSIPKPRSTDDLREMWTQEEDEIDYIISPRETKKKNTTPVKATPVKKDTKRKGKAVAANKPTKRQKIVELSDSEELDALPEVYQSDKGIDPEEIANFGIENLVNMVAESESQCDDIDEEQERRVSTHSSDDEDYVPTTEELKRGDDFEGVDVELDDIYSKEEDGRVKAPLEVGFKQLEVGMQRATVYEAREHMRRFGIVNHFTYISIKNDLTRLRFKCSEENCEWLVFISRNNDGHTMVLRHGNFQHSCKGRLGVENTLCNAPWVAREVKALVRDVRAMTPKAIKTRMKIKFGVEISYWTAWNARQICMESIVGSYDQGYNELPSLCVEILKSNPRSIARTWRQDDTLQWTGTLVAFRASLNGFVKGCRPILRLDGCFLKGKYGGVCLSVLSLDANNGLFPIGVYMCRTECKDSWTDFLTKVEPYFLYTQEN
ncbi:hypothetical protein GIB67_012938 [Kingdonia uniflora]|uniref:Transposase MuDR plant domain-containing protein n=1 Tax=Kingdonia uniflora TaxID=39325 RepID=A0A7J7NFN9_9MAGN|nr:hypothetical protein GIB67_012938 [Kingdonia uniflora]